MSPAKSGYVRPLDLKQGRIDLTHGAGGRASHLVFGPSVGGIMGKTVDQKVRPAVVEHVVERSTQVEQQLYADVVFLEGTPFVISLSEPLGLTILTDTQGSRKAEDLFRSLDGQIRTYFARGYKIDALHCDGEGGFAKFAGVLEDRGIRVDRAAPGKHVPRIERKIRVLKERLRAVMSTLPFKVPKALRAELYKYVVQRMNMSPHEGRVDPTPPRELFLGRKLSANTDLRLAFGDYCHIAPDVGAVKNSLEARTEAAIALHASGNQDGADRKSVV